MKGSTAYKIGTIAIVCFLVGIISVLAGWEPFWVTFVSLALVFGGVAVVAWAASRNNETW